VCSSDLLEEADIAVMILQGLKLELRAILGGEPEAIVAAFIGRQMLVQPGLVVIEERIMAEGTLAIGPAFGVHLQQAEIDTQLDFFLAVLALEFPDNNLSGFVRPVLEQWRNVEVHGANMNAKWRQVNARLFCHVI